MLCWLTVGVPNPRVFTHTEEWSRTHVKDVVHVRRFDGLRKHKKTQHALEKWQNNQLVDCGHSNGRTKMSAYLSNFLTDVWTLWFALPLVCTDIGLSRDTRHALSTQVSGLCIVFYLTHWLTIEECRSNGRLTGVECDVTVEKENWMKQEKVRNKYYVCCQCQQRDKQFGLDFTCQMYEITH